MIHAYKQEDRVFYNARDMAVVRGSLSNSPVVLSSATPSLESRVNADRGRYHYHRMAARYGEAVLPDINTDRHAQGSAAKGRVHLTGAA